MVLIVKFDMNMKKIFFMAAAVVAAAVPAKAESMMFNNPENEAYFGVRASVDISSAANGGAFYSNKPGFSVGAVYNIPIVVNLYFEPGLSLFYDVFGTVYFDTETVTIPATQPGGEATEKDVLYQVDGSVRNLGFRVPLNIGYHFDFAPDLKVNVFTGPQVNASLWARSYTYEYIKPTGAKVENSSESAFGTGGFKHIDLQWNFGVGLDYGRYMVAVQGSIGMTRLRDAVPLIQKNMRRNIFSITLGYNF